VAGLTFLFTDVVGSTKRWETDAEAMAADLAEHDAVISAAVGAHGGTLLKTKGEGDSTVSVFDRPADALAAAAAAQRAVAMPVRMAVHVGPAEARNGDYFGPTLNRTARLRAIAHGGQVICSEAVAFATDGALTDGLSLIAMGVHRLKDLAGPERVFQLAGDGLATDFPPLLSLNRSTTNLPAQQSSFIGRVAELAHVRALITQTRLVTLIGTGGSGKTRVALEAAAASFDEFPDGVWFCELAPISDGAAVGNVVATAANIGLFPGDATTQIVAALADKTALVVLDNCEHVVEGAATFAATLLAGAPNVRIIATSRERLRVAGESSWTVPPLGLPADDSLASTSEAVQLFVERAALVAPGLVVDHDTLDAVVAICRRVEAVPLAIELAAARVRMMTVQDLRARLEKHWDILSGGDRAALPHQRSLRATIDWSHSLLSPTAQDVLHRLAVFRGGFELSSAERVLVGSGTSDYEALDAVQDLVDKSLVGLDQETGRYRILETVREYALEQLEAAGLVNATRHAHATHFVDVLRDVEDRLLCVKDQRSALLRVADEHDNVVAALTWSLEHDHTIAAQLVGFSFGAWYGLGQAEAATWYRRLLPVIDELEGEIAVRACTAVGLILGYLGEKEIAFPLLDRAIAVGRTIDDVELLAMALSLYASIRHVYEELDAALPMAREAMAIPITSPRRLIRAWVCSLGSRILWDTGSREDARAAIVESHQLSLEHDDHVLRNSLLDGVVELAPDYMTPDQAHAARLDERDWLHRAGVADDAAAIAAASDDWLFVRERRWGEALDNIEHRLTLPQRNWRTGFDRRLKKSALLRLLDRPAEAIVLGELLVAEARNAVDRHHALCHLAIGRRDVGDVVGSEAARSEAMQYVLDGHNPASGWNVGPTNCIAGWMLLLLATLLVEASEDTATIARVVGAGHGLIDQEDFDFEFELACVRHGYENRLPEPDAAARAFAASATLTDVLAFLER
jgi:predicted ATPase/class 3 adenylate cyclase